MLNQSTADAHPFVHVLPAGPRDAHDPLPVMRREMKLLLIELNLLRVEVEQCARWTRKRARPKIFSPGPSTG